MRDEPAHTYSLHTQRFEAKEGSNQNLYHLSQWLHQHVRL